MNGERGTQLSVLSTRLLSRLGIFRLDIPQDIKIQAIKGKLFFPPKLVLSPVFPYLVTNNSQLNEVLSLLHPTQFYLWGTY